MSKELFEYFQRAELEKRAEEGDVDAEMELYALEQMEKED